ncbi:MAG TPA: response regulator [Candidatus Binataceae bacterium]|nr:response regulator [Candidatus Binataceae bacterium]
MNPAADITRGKILVVDDNEDILETMSLLLTASGFEVVAAHHGGEALSRLRTEDQVDLIVLDLSMPTMDGREFLRRKRQQASGIAQIPVLVVSSVAASSVTGAVGVLRKPFDPQRLIDIVARHARPAGDVRDRN